MDENNHSIFVGEEEMNLRSKKMLYDSDLHHQYMGKHFTRNPKTAKDNRLKQSENENWGSQQLLKVLLLTSSGDLVHEMVFIKLNCENNTQ